MICTETGWLKAGTTGYELSERPSYNTSVSSVIQQTS